MRPLVPLFLVLLATSASAQFFSTDPADYERTLVPVAGRTAGLYGSEWTATVSGYADFGTNFVVPYCTRGIICGDEYFLKGATPSTFAVNAQVSGSFLYVLKTAVDNVDLVVHVRDDAHPADSNVDLPVVRARDFHPNIRLLDVPIASSVRSMLRVYGDHAGTVTVRTLDASGNQIGTTSLQLAGDFVANGFVITPATAALPVYFDGQSSVMLDITSDTGAPIWAFVSVTNNDTQHINVIVPFRKD
ncbi:MAG TPA: hypothetical protein VGJ82_22880 [Thermoanaerobaculia bacterium]|jgi:hypothetical protein